jgi:hypothetical protein
MVAKLVKKIHTFYGTWRFITVFTASCHWSLSWATLYPLPPYFLNNHFNLILSSHLCLCLLSGHLFSGFPPKILYVCLISSHACHMPGQFIILHPPLTIVTIFGEKYKLWSSSLCTASSLFIPLRSKQSSHHPVLKHCHCVLPLMRETKSDTHTKQQVNYSFVYFNFYILTTARKMNDFELNGDKHFPNVVCS